VLQLFYRALSGRGAVLATDGDIAARHQLDGADTVRLPDDQPAGWYRLALAHRATHEDAGTGRFRLDRPGRIFPRARAAAASRRAVESDLYTAIRSAAEPRLAAACFAVLEELRIDELLALQYPGLARGLRELQDSELARRPPLPDLAPSARLLEVLVRASLGWRGAPGAAPAPDQPGRELTGIAGRLAQPGATVEDTVAAAMMAHDIIRDAAVADPRADLTFAPVQYRAALDSGLPGPGLLDTDWDAEPADDQEGPDAAWPARPGRPRTRAGARPFPADAGTPQPAELDPDAADPDAAGPLDDDQEHTDLDAYLYPEWDYRAGAYRQRWCRVSETVAATALTAETYRRALSEHPELVAQIRRQFEQIAPETLRRVRGVREGDELDIDACIDAFADLRAGVPPSDNLYVMRDRTQRDVAVVFLVDLSYSTRQYVTRRGRSYKPIFDVEREALILLMEPLARVGDVFGMYGFSGDGRHDVRIVVIKDVSEPLSARVIGRLDGLQPIHSTRMGAAIRHATSKLRGVQVGTRLLMVISDGRPSDIDYGQEYGNGAEVEYAIRDTRAALDETRAQGIRPFLLTVDANGSDYLRFMCDELDYEVLSDVDQLPERLAALYGSLSTSGRGPRPAPTGGASRADDDTRPPSPQLWLSRPAVG
jgi:hypothetical protein